MPGFGGVLACLWAFFCSKVVEWQQAGRLPLKNPDFPSWYCLCMVTKLRVAVDVRTLHREEAQGAAARAAEDIYVLETYEP